METINAILEFLNSYETWAKILMLTGVLITVSTLVLSPRNKKKLKSDSSDFLELVNNTRKREEFKAKIVLDKDLLPDYLKSKSAYDAINYTYNLKIQSETIDVVLFYHYNEQSQAVHYLFLTKFYDIDVENVNWEELNNDWDKFSQLIEYDGLKEALGYANGFNSPLEFPNPMGGESYRPKIVFVQVCGRRKGLNAVDLSKMQQLNSSQQNEVYRFPVTYDFVLDGFNGLM